MGCLKLDISPKNFPFEKVLPGGKSHRAKTCADAYLFFFNGMVQEYDYASQKPVSAPVLLPEATSKYQWLVGTNLWLTGPDAIMYDESGMIYFFKNPAQ